MGRKGFVEGAPVVSGSSGGGRRGLLVSLGPTRQPSWRAQPASFAHRCSRVGSGPGLPGGRL